MPLAVLLISALLAASIAPAAADVLVLRNGSRLEGRIVEERGDVLVFCESGITLTLRRSQIVSIERAEPTASEAVPPAPEIKDPELRASLRQAQARLVELDRLEKEADLGRRELERCQARKHQLEEEKRALIAALHEGRSQLEALRPPSERNQFGAYPAGYRRQVRAYSDKLIELQSVESRLVACENALQENQVALGRATQAPQQYVHAVGQHVQGWSAVSAALDPSRVCPAAARNIRELDSSFGRHANRLRDHAIPHRRHGQHLVVTVRLNDRADVELLVDTGASTLMISRGVAERAGIALSSQRVAVRLADGREIPMQMGLADWVQTGSARAAMVPVSVSEAPMLEQIDGLLGMSFLGRFDVSIDLQKERFILRSLDPPSAR